MEEILEMQNLDYGRSIYDNYYLIAFLQILAFGVVQENSIIDYEMELPKKWI